MHALSQSAPQLGQSRDVPLQSMPSPSAPPMTGEPQTATHHPYPEILPPSQGEDCHVSRVLDLWMAQGVFRRGSLVFNA